MANKKGNKQKALVEALLNKKGISYDDWLEEKHMEYITQNAGTLLSALNFNKKENG
jgi:hypothetical protein